MTSAIAVPSVAPASRKQQVLQARFLRHQANHQTFRKLRSKVSGFFGGDEVLVASATIVKREEHEGVTYFRLRCQSRNRQDLIWDVIRRYNEFLNLKQELGVRDGRVGSSFPEKTWFSKCEGQVLEDRQHNLQIWIAGLLKEFDTFGDGRHTLITWGRNSKLASLHRFLGLTPDGQLLPHACLLQSASASSGQSVHEAPLGSAVHPDAAQALQCGENDGQLLTSAAPSAAVVSGEAGQNDHSLDNAPEGVTEQQGVFQVDVPPGTEAGQEILVEVDGRSYSIAVPESHTGVLEFTVPLHAK